MGRPVQRLGPPPGGRPSRPPAVRRGSPPRKESVMSVANADAVWEGGLKDGKGTMKLGSGAFDGSYSFRTRFEGAPGTNPEELIGAAHAGCFSMALSAGLGQRGLFPAPHQKPGEGLLGKGRG